jgi:hypothetical protein
MDRQKINRLSGIVPIVSSLVAFCVVMLAVLTGSEQGRTDEGALAHTFQLLIVAQVPSFWFSLPRRNGNGLSESLV